MVVLIRRRPTAPTSTLLSTTATTLGNRTIPELTPTCLVLGRNTNGTRAIDCDAPAVKNSSITKSNGDSISTKPARSLGIISANVTSITISPVVIVSTTSQTVVVPFELSEPLETSAPSALESGVSAIASSAGTTTSSASLPTLTGIAVGSTAQSSGSAILPAQSTLASSTSPAESPTTSEPAAFTDNPTVSSTLPAPQSFTVATPLISNPFPTHPASSFGGGFTALPATISAGGIPNSTTHRTGRGAVIAGGVVGGVILGTVAVFLFAWLYRRRRPGSKSLAQGSSGMPKSWLLLSDSDAESFYDRAQSSMTLHDSRGWANFTPIYGAQVSETRLDSNQMTGFREHSFSPTSQMFGLIPFQNSPSSSAVNQSNEPNVLPARQSSEIDHQIMGVGNHLSDSSSFSRHWATFREERGDVPPINRDSQGGHSPNRPESPLYAY